MRTTLTLDEDVARAIRQLEQQTRRRPREVINDLLRRGLGAGARPAAPPPRFKVRARASGFQPGLDLLKLNQLADELETGRAAGRQARARP